MFPLSAEDREVTALEAQSYEKILPHANTAILYIHGILGTPLHFRDFFPLADHCSQYSILLAGHGGEARDFSRASMGIWKQQVHSKILELLDTHRDLLIVAHSMGTLFAISEALAFPDRVKGLFLLAAPLKVAVRPVLAVNCWKVFWGTVSPGDSVALAAQRAYGIRQDFRIWRYLGWAPRYIELFREIRRVRSQLCHLTVPVIAYQSSLDEMVSPKAARLLQAVPSAQVEVLNHATHFYYDPQELTSILNRFSEFVQPVPVEGGIFL